MSGTSRFGWAFVVWLGASGALAQVQERSSGSAVERHISADSPVTRWVHDPEILEEDTGDMLQRLEVATTNPNIVKLKGLVPPIRFPSGAADIPQSTVRELERVLGGLSDRQNVRLHLVGHADNQRLMPGLAAVYGDNAGLSRERAGEVAEFFKSALQLEVASISYEWAGDTQPIASNDSAKGRAQNRRVEVQVWFDKLEDGITTKEVVVAADAKRVKVCRLDTLCKLTYRDGYDKRARLQNLIAPLQYDRHSVDVTPAFLERIRRTLANLQDKQNVVVKFVGHTDGQPLDARAKRIYGSHEGLAKARAWRVALAAQAALGLATAAIDATGLGSERTLASDNTAEGQAMNRRVEVEFWYDDPLRELPDEPHLCPTPGDEDRVTLAYRPPWGDLPSLEVGQGPVELPRNLSAVINRALEDVAHRDNPRVRFAGYTGNAALDRRTARVYGDDIGLSAARAQRAMAAVQQAMGLAEHQVEFEGRGFVHSNDVVNAGFTQESASYVAVEVVYDDYAMENMLDGLQVQPINRELEPENPFALNLMRITVDGKPVDDPGRSSADLQRCTDVALQATDIRFAFDGRSVQRRLAVDAAPSTIAVTADHAQLVDPVSFRVHANYLHFIARSEIRLFEVDASTRGTPLAVVPVDAGGRASWNPEPGTVGLRPRPLRYVVRAYAQDGTFDETGPRSLWLIGADARPEGNGGSVSPTLLTSYGDSQLTVQNIRLSSGTVRVQGSAIPDGYDVWVAGHPVPVDANGRFVTEQILPEGVHTVEVAVLDEAGNGELFLRDLEFTSNDWFYVGMADITVSQSEGSGAFELLDGSGELDETLAGRLAFYADGKFGDKWHLTTSLDTDEGPLDEWFKDFVDKSPDALLRRIDPDYHYPTFGDDSHVSENAPTSGKFYLKAGRNETHALWGNFNVTYDQNELARVDRGLYGGNLHHESRAMTSFGERRFSVDGFAAEPGTIPTWQEFRGTGGSLYFLKHQDLLVGSERLRIEIRDPTSGLAARSVELRPGVDYDIDYLQGTVLLSEPLTSTAYHDLLIRDTALSGDEAFLVARYEYTPGFDEIDAVAAGGQAHYWIGNHMKIGLTAHHNELDATEGNLKAGHVVVRKSASTWVKWQTSETGGQLADTLRSDDGGFRFADAFTTLPTDAKAKAGRVDVSVGLEDVFSSVDGRMTWYRQDMDAGYATPGVISVLETKYEGGMLTLPVGGFAEVTAKSDTISQSGGLHNERHEGNLAFALGSRWQLATGVRQDIRENDSVLAFPAQSLGERVDAVVQLGYRSDASWRLYGYAQETLRKTGERGDNGRVGVGGEIHWSDKVGLDGELSTGDTGTGGRLGTTYQASERTSLYLNYALEDERTDNVLRTYLQRQGNLIAGARTRLSDTMSIYGEERYRHGAMVSGLTHTTGVSYQPSSRWNLGVSTDIGTLRNLETGAETERNAAGLRLSYVLGKISVSTGVEYRRDDAELSDLSLEQRETWLLRSSFKFQSSDSARWLGKVGHSTSASSLGQFYDGGFTEASLGYAFRPVAHDRLNALVKYSYFYNVPTTEQVTLKGTPAEFIQKSHVAAVDLTYDLTPRWSVGGKYAYRLGELSIDRVERQFFDNRAHLFVLRTDYRVLERWEVLVEGRQLTMPDFGETRAGGLVAVSRYLGEHLKLGVGYSFTDFSDDLTDLDFDHRGAFLNITGVL